MFCIIRSGAALARPRIASKALVVKELTFHRYLTYLDTASPHLPAVQPGGFEGT
jgi:hypothetical protein